MRLAAANLESRPVGLRALSGHRKRHISWHAITKAAARWRNRSKDRLLDRIFKSGHTAQVVRDAKAFLAMKARTTPGVTQPQKCSPPFENHDIIQLTEGFVEDSLPPLRPQHRVAERRKRRRPYQPQWCAGAAYHRRAAEGWPTEHPRRRHWDQHQPNKNSGCGVRPHGRVAAAESDGTPRRVWPHTGHGAQTVNKEKLLTNCGR